MLYQSFRVSSELFMKTKFKNIVAGNNRARHYRAQYFLNLKTNFYKTISKAIGISVFLNK